MQLQVFNNNQCMHDLVTHTDPVGAGMGWGAVSRVLSRKFLLGGSVEKLKMYGRGPLRARRFCKECTETHFICFEFGSSMNLTSREKVSVHWGN